MQVRSPEKFTWQGHETQRGIRPIPLYILLIVCVVGTGLVAIIHWRDKPLETRTLALVKPSPQLKERIRAAVTPKLTILNDGANGHASRKVPLPGISMPSTTASPERRASSRNYFSLRAEMLEERASRN